MKKSLLIFLFISIILTELFLLWGKDLPFTRNQKLLSNLLAEDAPSSLAGAAIVKERNRWSKVIDLAGPEKAYAAYKIQYQKNSFGTQHLMAHIIGSLLYEKEGLKGQAICDSTFSFGCYHSFFSEALINHGPEIIATLNQICLDRFGPLGTGCQHGIGHGVMDYFKEEKLLEALEACKDTTATTEIAGCTSGVFMEYNVPVIISDSSAIATSRPINVKTPYAPCPSLPEKFQASCYYSIGQWWNQTTPFHNDWKNQGLLCQNLPNKKFEEDCFLGVGNVVAPGNNYDPEKSIQSCKKMPDKKSIIICQAGASWSFAANESFKTLAIKMCGQLDPEETQECLRRGNLLNPENQQND